MCTTWRERQRKYLHFSLVSSIIRYVLRFICAKVRKELLEPGRAGRKAVEWKNFEESEKEQQRQFGAVGGRHVKAWRQTVGQALIFLNEQFLKTHYVWSVKVKSLSRVQLFSTPWTVAHQAPPSMEFSRQEYWSGLPFPSPGGLPDPGIEPGAPALQADAVLSEPPGGWLYMWSVEVTNSASSTLWCWGRR